MKYMNRQFLLSFVLFFIANILSAQIKGKLTNQEGEPLAFASVYVKGTSVGTTSNVDGVYLFSIGAGTYEIVFQYVGYRQLVKRVTVTDKVLVLNVVMEEEVVEAPTVVVSASAEDPAYSVIRKAIKKRKYYLKAAKSYNFDAYVKGNQKIIKAPEKLFGTEVGAIFKSLDSTRTGIIYLSESVSKVYYQAPDKKEIMTSSKVSGNDNGFSWNRASEMDFNFYENHIDVMRNLISPIASNALSYYNYKLLGTIFDEAGRMINKIEVIPKRSEDPVFRGLIYITEDLWNIHSTELIVTGNAIKIKFLDTLVIKQVHIPVKEPDVWFQLSQSLDFKYGFMGLKVKGNFTGIFSNYSLEPLPDPDFFNNEVFKVEEGANEKDSSYWNTIRPVPLTSEESVDYVRKDSLQVVWESKPYLDSIDLKRNKFKVWDLLFGYRYRNSYERNYLDFESPVTAFQFNTVQGAILNLNVAYQKAFDKYRMRYFRITPMVEYGFADKQLRGSLKAMMQFEAIRYSRLSIGGGRETQQFDQQKPISRLMNTSYALFGKENYIKLYDKYYGNIGASMEVANGFYLSTSLEYAERKALTNHSDYSFFQKDKIYDSNDPLYPENFTSAFESDKSLELGIRLRIRINQKYISYPDRRFIDGSKWPDLWIQYRKGISGILGSTTNFDHLELVLSENAIAFGLVGYSRIRLAAGSFLNKERTNFMDIKHFNGNEIQFVHPNKFRNGFMLLPYYSRSTQSNYFQANFQHNFEGFILDKIPLVNKLAWKFVVGSSFLYTEDKKDYWEWSVGLDNIGWGLFRFFRIDYVLGYDQGKFFDSGFKFGIKL